ncbi:MAG: hypothetical protein AAGD14_05125 [Planctomycetota bacterium]
MATLRWGGFYLRFHLGLALVPLALLVVGGDFWLRYLMLLGVLVAHELGHAGMAFLQGGRRAVVTIWPWGGVAHVPHFRDRREAWVALAAPGVNLLLAALFFALGGRLTLALGQCPYADLMLTANLLMGLGNLIPLPRLDGGRALRALRRPVPA